MTLFSLFLGCTTGKFPDTGCVSEDPCDCGVAWTERLGAFETIQDAVDVVTDGETIHLCEGEIATSVWFPPLGSRLGTTTFALAGAGVGVTRITQANRYQAAVLVAEATVAISDCSLADGQGSAFYRSSDDVVTDSYSVGGAIVAGGSVLTLERVEVRDNVANYGGGLAVDSGAQEPPLHTEITLIDSSVLSNRARHLDSLEGGGGAWLSGDFRLTSVNTDWGTGATENLDDDIAIGDLGSPKNYYTDFGAAEDFVCTSETGTCERTE